VRLARRAGAGSYRYRFQRARSVSNRRRTCAARFFRATSSGRLGRRGIPYLLLFQVLLQLLAPVIDVAAVFSLFTDDATTIGLTWLLFRGVQLVGAGYAFVLDGERLRTLWALPVQQLVYRQLMYLVVIQSVASAAYGLRLRWHKLDRTGVLDSAPPSAPTPSTR
jgi:hypothetical protein